MNEKEALEALKALIGGRGYGGYSYHEKAIVVLTESLDERDRLITLCSQAALYVAKHAEDSAIAMRLLEQLQAVID